MKQVANWVILGGRIHFTFFCSMYQEAHFWLKQQDKEIKGKTIHFLHVKTLLIEISVFNKILEAHSNLIKHMIL